MAIDYTFLMSFSKTLQGSLNEKLELGQANATARCKTYIQEDVGIAAERDELNKTKKQLESVWSELLNYSFPSSPTD